MNMSEFETLLAIVCGGFFVCIAVFVPYVRWDERRHMREYQKMIIADEPAIFVPLDEADGEIIVPHWTEHGGYVPPHKSTPGDTDEPQNRKAVH